MRLAAFDPRVRTLSGLAAYSARQRYLSALHCQQKMGRLGRLRGLRGLPFADGNWSRLSGFRGLRGLSQGDEDVFGGITPFMDLPAPPPDYNYVQTTGPSAAPAYNPTTINTVPIFGTAPGSYDPSTYVPTLGTNAQLQAAGYSPAYPGATLNPGSNPTYPAAPPLSSQPGQAALTAAQVAAQAAGGIAVIPNPALQPAPGTTLGIPNQYFVYGGVALLGVMLLGSMSKRR